jgi:Cu(I)/Ag(I) efflux system membrane fusion protein
MSSESQKHEPQGHEELPEGVEAPPPGVRTMAAVRWALIALMAVAAAGAWVYFARTGESHQAHEKGEANFICPMHPSVTSERAGSCPICGMDLVPISAAMKAQAGGTGPATAGAGRYWCPMHPEVASDDPNAICTKCGGMKLIPREMVPGLAPVEIGIDRVQLIGMKTAVASVERLSPTLRTVGTVTADESAVVVISSRINGWVEQVLVPQAGEAVKKGQALARFNSPDLSTAQLNYLNAIKWTRDRTAAQPAQGASALEYDARSRLLVLGIGEEDVKELEARGKPLETLSIRSPVSGYLSRRLVQAGASITPGQELFEIANLSSVWVIAEVYEADIGRVRVGQKANISLQALPGQTFAGKVSFIHPAVNPLNRTVQVRIVIANRMGMLRPGMLADVVLDLGAAKGVTVPADALVETGESQYVFLSMPGGRFEPRKVQVGARAGDRVQILSGVSAGETVVTTANFLVDSESRLRAALQGMGSEPAPAEPAAGHGAPAPADPHAKHRP